MTVTTTTTTPAPRPAPASDFKPCPICGRGIRRVLNRPDGTTFEPDVCNGYFPKDGGPRVGGCMDRRHAYAKEMADRRFRGEKDVAILDFRAWVLSQIDIPALEAKVVAAKAEDERLNALAEVATKERAGGYIPRDSFLILRNNVRREVLPNENRSASGAHWALANAEAHLNSALETKSRLEKEETEAAEKRAAKTAAETAPAAAELVTVADSVPAPATAKKPKKGK